MYRFYELKKLIKNNAVIITVASIIMCALFVLTRNLIQNQITENTTNSELQVGLSKEEVSKAAVAQFYIENESGSIFGNTLVLEQFFHSPLVLQELQSATSFDITEIGESAQHEFRYIEINKDKSSQLMTAVSSAGDEEQNMEILKFYYDYLRDKEANLMQNKKFYEFIEPTLARNLLNENKEANDFKMIRNWYKDIVVGLVLGAVVSFVLVFAKAFIDPKLSYSFGYVHQQAPDFLFVTKGDRDNDTLKNFVATPSMENLYILGQKSSNRLMQVLDELPVSIHEVHQFYDLNKLPEHTTILLVVEAGKTQRKWYEEQLVALEHSELAFSTIHLA